MSFQIHRSINEIPAELSVAYFQKGYFNTQSYTQFIAFSADDLFIAFDMVDGMAISIPRSPFGSFVYRKAEVDLSSFIDEMLLVFKEEGILSIKIHHPSEIYSDFISSSDLLALGFHESYVDINQHVALDQDIQLHTMQKRKLEGLQRDGFEFRKMEPDEYETAHKFLTICRESQGLQINISWDHLSQLIDQLPNTYECFGVFREERISAVCFTVNVTKDVAYYFLPGTGPLFRSHSPMVLLMTGMMDYYSAKGYRSFDLGISSIQGKPQETLRIFKERMGAVETLKPTFDLTL